MFKSIINFLKDFFDFSRPLFERIPSKEWKKLNKEAEGLIGLKRLLVYHKDIKHAGVYSTITDIVDTLEEHEERIKKMENNL